VQQLGHLDVVNIGAAGTLVIRRPVSRATVRAEIARRLPFGAEIMICPDRDIHRLLARDFFAGHPPRPDIVRFVSLLSRRPRSSPNLPLRLPSSGPWLLKVLAREGPFVVGVYRRRMKTIGYLGLLDDLFGGPVTTRSWGTLDLVARVLTADRSPVA
jgi:hypothetical protein